MSLGRFLRRIAAFPLVVAAGCAIATSPAWGANYSAGHGCKGPTIAPAGTRIIGVATEPQLQSAVGSLQAGDTVVLADGTYNLTSSLYIKVANVTIMGRGPGCGAAVLAGQGEDNSAGVPYGIWTNAPNTTVAQLQIRDTYDNNFNCDQGCQAPHLYNVSLVNAGSQFVKISTATPNVAGAIVEYSRFEYTAFGPGNHAGLTGYFNGISAHSSTGLIVRDNTFYNLHDADGCDTNFCYNPSVLVWFNSVGTLVERNLFINVDGGVSFGLTQRTGLDHQGGIIRNNVFYMAPGFWSASRAAGADAALRTWESPGSKVYNNTVIGSGNYPYCFINKFATSTNVTFANNLCDAPFDMSRSSASGSAGNDVINATAAFFTAAATADLHLALAAGPAIAQGANLLADVPADFDLRPRSIPMDIGAFQSSSSPLLPPTNVRVVP